MGQSTLTWLSPLIGALVTGAIGYIIAWRKTSGRIATTEAAKLWDEASDLRQVYQDEIERLGREIVREREERERLEGHNRKLRSEVVDLQRKVDAVERENARLVARVEELENGWSETA